ncbi:uncharacterized protein LTR77_002440 [Saxophila tyrrhenica]|uniref:F-box domain-containing protein n=1 Tax=Saxophila tyrrhenica TaxID=1690608 RepID=A0AAV9PIL9_9PEZI|nr:hypothetical protein LTR77_002440 [Saxophila tyrrhenica]
MGGPQSLVRLPVELQKEIVDFLRSHKDLRAVSLYVATPKLYREIYLPVASINARLRSCFNLANTNLKYTRFLFVAEVCSESYDHQKQGRHMFDLVHAFPNDALEELHIGTLANVPIDFTIQLFYSQKKLRNYWMHPQSSYTVEPGVTQCLLQSPEEFTRIVKLDLMSGSMSDCHQSSHVLGATPALQELTIVFKNSLRQTSASALNAIFERWTRVDDIDGPRCRLALNKLRLAFVHCSAVGPLLSRVIDISKLAALQLHSCRDTSNLLLEFDQKGMDLSRFVQKSHEHITSTLEPVMTRQTSLTELFIHKWAPRTTNLDCYAETIERCGKSLQILYLEDEPTSYQTRKQQADGEPCSKALHDLCANCPNVEQLAFQPSSNPARSDVLNTNNLSAMRAADLIFSRLRKSCPRFVALHMDVLRRDECTSTYGHEEFSYIRHIRTDSAGNVDAGGRRISTWQLHLEEPQNDIF